MIAPTDLRKSSGRFARDSGVAMVSTWSSYAIGAVGGIILARALHPEGKGTYALLFLGGILAGAAGTLGTDLWSTKQKAKLVEPGVVFGVVRRHLHTLTLLLLGLLGLMTAVMGLLFQSLPPVELVATLALTLSSVWYVSLLGILRGARDMKGLLIMQLAAAGVFLVGIGALWLAGRASVVTALLVAIGGRCFAVGLGPWQSVFRATNSSVHDWWTVVRTHGSASIGVIAEFASYRVDVLFVALFLTTTEVGFYSVALPLSELLWLLPNALAQVLLPQIAASGSTATTAAATRIAVTVSSVFAVVLVLFSTPVIRWLYGDEFGPAAKAIPLLALGAVILSAWKLVTTDLLARGQSSIRAKGGAIAILVLCVSLPGLTSRYGLRGAALASTLAYGAAAIHGIAHWRRLPGASMGALVPGKRGDLEILARVARGLRSR